MKTYSLDDIDGMVAHLAPRVFRWNSGQVKVRTEAGTDTLRISFYPNLGIKRCGGLSFIETIVRAEVEDAVERRKRMEHKRNTQLTST